LLCTTYRIEVGEPENLRTAVGAVSLPVNVDRRIDLA
jgi:hypothetical protein